MLFGTAPTFGLGAWRVPPPAVYASVAVVSDDKAPDWLADDDDGMAWGDDRLPTNIRGI